MTEPLSPEREQGIRLEQTITKNACVHDLLAELDRLRGVIQGLNTELSVHERKNRISRQTLLTQAEESMLRFALDCVQEIYASRPFEFTQGDADALKSLRDMAGMQ